MFNRLKQKWKVNGLQLALIITTFAIGGSLTGYAGRKLLNFFSIDKGWLWIVIYIILICLLWPLAVLLVSIPFGQYKFFTKYIKKIGKRIGITPKPPPAGGGLLRIAIFASGTGSNAQKIIEYFASPPTLLLPERGVSDIPIIEVSLIVSNNSNAGVLRIAEKYNIPTLVIEKEKFFRGNAYVDELKEKQIDFIVLAGFMWKIPDGLIKAYPNRIINIHPALLPKYGGKGLYGNYVHETVLANKEKESGISIHYVDEIYDHGKIIFQAKCAVMKNDTADSLAQRIHALEHEHYPKVIEEVVSQRSQISQKSHKSL
ncbi:MAG TPA: phosphoribosylglycinamide formyltransferase [Chitinophagaceae bacterium]|nr:phosphoribosylglycinamide formyltransferase [Chitinophagaceae bacterium]